MGRCSPDRRWIVVVGAQAIMGTAIVSIDLLLDHLPAPSAALMGVALGLWVGIAVAIGGLLRRDPVRLGEKLGGAVSLSCVAATAVVGTRFAMEGWTWAGAGMLVVAAALVGVLLPGVHSGWRTPVAGSAFLLSVSVSALAILAADISAAKSARWLLILALTLLITAFALYAAVAVRFPPRELLRGAGDHWIAGGAVAIAGLATGQLALDGKELGTLAGLEGPLHAAAWALWFAAMAWLVLLAAAEAARPRLRIDDRRWATVFPVGMYAAMSFVLGRLLAAPAITTFARVWVWVALSCWALVSARTISLLWGGGDRSRRAPAARGSHG
jgi:hypothetical protein